MGLWIGLVAAAPAWSQSWSDGGVTEGRWMLGARVGPTTLTQQLGSNLDTATGSVLNFQGMYGLNRWAMVGLMLEWERRSVDTERPRADLGSLDTVSVMPTVEIRPGHWGSLYPYGSMSLGVNVNSFSEDSSLGGTRISPSNNFAFRLAAGGDYFITEHLAFNTELAWKRNDGHAIVGPARVDSWNASSFNFLLGVRWFF
ncbi:MAG TPA: outer membrane beta-barrel protein [Nitrospira sp.]|nr:outer membrane beta-barrel protein [Nitrospira sp.]